MTDLPLRNTEIPRVKLSNRKETDNALAKHERQRKDKHLLKTLH